MDWHRRLNPLNHLAGKIFLWFWLMIVLTIFTLIFITTQIAPSIEQSPVPSRIAYKVHNVEEHLNGSAARHSNADFSRLLRSRRSRHDHLFAFFDEQGKMYSNRRLPKTFNPDSLDLDTLVPSAKVDNDIVAYGPFAITVGEQSYRMFALEPYAPHPMRQFRELPAWLRIGLPLLISALLSYFLAHTLVHPIRQLRNAHRELAEGNLDARSNGVAARNDELGELGQDFDDMAKKITALLAAQKRLLGDVSHELRSPLARIQIALGLAMQPDSKDLERHLQRIELEANRLDDMIGDVLRLSRLESQLQNVEKFPLSLGNLLEVLVKDAAFEAKGHDKGIELFADEPLQVNGDQALLASAFENIIRNGVKYTEADTCVEIHAIREGQQAVVTIRDHGPGVPASALTQLFQPFYRVSDSRQRASGGTGLGLAITEKAVRSHGGSIIAHNHQEKGLEITVRLPLE